ncbi:MAG: ATP-binding protein [Desulfobacteraceae bacterium]|nr:ATP-binding protein [Desulfobacteraceae bacterium]
MRNIVQQHLADAISMDLPELTERECQLPEIPNKIQSVIGMRRSGKTYFLYQIMKQCMADGVDRSRLVYFNFEDERLAELSVENLHWIPDEYFAMFPENRSEEVFFFFDEIQLVDGWERFVRRLLDTETVQIFVSGSSAKMLSREIASSLRGRSVEIIIYPYSFREFTRHHGIQYSRSLKRINSKTRSLLENLLIRYLKYGGFPEAQGLLRLDRQLLLQGYVNAVLFRDIVERFGVINITVLKTLIRHLIKNAGARFTVNKFYNHLKSQGFKVAKTTLHEYISHLQDAFLLHTIPIYTDSERKRMVNPIKPYIIDTGLVASFLSSRDPDLGHLLENSILMELCRRNARVNYLITPSGFEVDFLAEYPDGIRQAIQVAADISDPITRDRECRAFIESRSIVPDAEFLLINLSEEDVITINGVSIKLIPAWKWLLDKT